MKAEFLVFAIDTDVAMHHPDPMGFVLDEVKAMMADAEEFEKLDLQPGKAVLVRLRVVNHDEIDAFTCK
jgi:DNA-binding GntR family transcriptional regulator